MLRLIAIATLVLLTASGEEAVGERTEMIQNDDFERFLTAARAWHDPNDTLDGDYLVDPPEDDYGYFNTPANSLTFLAMGVDGVHTAMLKLDGAVRRESPVIYVSPTDGAWTILAPTFIDFLSDGCAVPPRKIGELLDTVDSDPAILMRFLQSNFDGTRLQEEDRIKRLNAQFLDLVEKKDEYKEMEASWGNRD
ncbi:MAG: hypothetical protein AAFN07_15365 [Pseudomonadota bacterium]